MDHRNGGRMSRPERLYTSFAGRIGRKTYWLGTLSLVLLPSILTSTLGIWFGTALSSPNITTRAQMYAMAAAQSRVLAWVNAILFFILALPTLAIWLKRRHDRDSDGKDAMTFLAFSGVSSLLYAFGIGWSFTGRTGSTGTPELWMIILCIVQGAFGLYMSVVLGFPKGTTGPNRYGPDPVGPDTLPADARTEIPSSARADG
jgi:uncharacterized membrane protein YhaH (DUF805 family)